MRRRGCGLRRDAVVPACTSLHIGAATLVRKRDEMGVMKHTNISPQPLGSLARLGPGQQAACRLMAAVRPSGQASTGYRGPRDEMVANTARFAKEGQLADGGTYTEDGTPGCGPVCLCSAGRRICVLFACPGCSDIHKTGRAQQWQSA